jgi:hypothetical protein
MVRLSRQLLLGGCLTQAILLSAFGESPAQQPLPVGEAKKNPDLRKTERIDLLIRQLGSNNFQEREAASRALEGIGVPAFPALQKAVGTNKDPEIRARASSLIRTLETAHETEVAFAWFDDLGFPDLAKCKFIRLATGQEYSDEHGTLRNSCQWAFLINDQGKSFKALTLSLAIVTCTKSPPDVPERRRIAYEPWDLQKEAAGFLSSSRPLEGKGEWPLWFGQRLSEPTELLIWARACSAHGYAHEAKELLARAKQKQTWATADADGKSFYQMIADDIAPGQLRGTLEAFGTTTLSRKALLTQFRGIVEHYPGSSAAREAREAVAVLEKMVAEDEAHARRPVSLEKESKRLIAELIFGLRDQNVSQLSRLADIFTGDRYNLPGWKKSPAQRLLEMDYEAVPQLIAAIGDQRFSRCVGIDTSQGWPADGRGARFFPYVLRVGDCAVAILEEIAGRTFSKLGPTERATLNEARANAVKGSVQAWWQEAQRKGEKQMLIEGVRSGTDGSPGLAQRLVKKYPDSALAAIREGTHHGASEWIVKGLVECAAQLPRELPVSFLREQLHGSSPAARVAAARGLLDRGYDAGVRAMIHEWENGRHAEPSSDLIYFLLWCGRVEALKALAKDLGKRPVNVGADVLYCLNDTTGEQYAKSVSAAIQEEVDELLASELEDTRQRMGMSGVTDDKHFTNPRLCDLSAHLLARRWKQPSWFDLEASLITRDQQRTELRKQWLKRKGKQPVRK